MAGIIDEDVGTPFDRAAPELAALRIGLAAEHLGEFAERRILHEEDVLLAKAERAGEVGPDRLGIVMGEVDRAGLLVGLVADHHRDRVGVVRKGDRRRLRDRRREEPEPKQGYDQERRQGHLQNPSASAVPRWRVDLSMRLLSGRSVAKM